jgi:tRNA threonylcarbamoyladenosine biosynthesis protein TsaB
LKSTVIEKPILAVETSGNLCSTAVLLKNEESIELNLNIKHIHSEQILPTIETVLGYSKLELKDLNHIAVSIGPGSFTGLRVGLSAVKGIALGASLPIVPVPTFDALALQLSGVIEYDKKFIICNNVNREEIYLAKYIKTEESFKEIEKLALIRKDQLNEQINGDELLFGDYPKKDSNGISSPGAEFVARWSYIFGKDLLTWNFDYLEPYYLKNFVARVKK